MQTLGLVANVYNEANALPGWLETHAPYFDHIAVYHSGPQRAKSNDGTIEILEKWRIPITWGSIDAGYGIVRNLTFRCSPCDWVMLLDADERFYPVHRTMICSGESTPHSEVDTILQSYDFHDLKTTLPNWENLKRLGANLRVDIGASYDQGARLREILAHDPHIDAVATIRRHWHDFSFRKPTQNWYSDPDWQMRLVRNDPSIYFDPNTRMHECLRGTNRVFWADMGSGPFFDHFHFTFKRMEQEQRSHDIAVYNAINDGKTPPTWEEFQKL
jgi:glycosyltransferase involved in cell wall biosynthesis